MAVEVLHEDAAVLAVAKPPGWLVIPGRDLPGRAAEPSLREALTARHGPLWVVHRLDRGTSGVLLFARTAEAHRALNLAFEAGQADKTYLALVAGLPPEAWTCEVALVPARKGRMKPAPPGDTRAKEARTRFRRLEAFPAAPGRPALALVEARPETGRTHQIRVHLRAAGHPLCFDPDYGGTEPLRDGAGREVLARTPLHAARLVVPHPAGGTLSVACPAPPDLEACLRLLRG